MAATGAQDYEAEISTSGGIETTTASGLSIDYTGLIPDVVYSFRVRSRKPHGSAHLFSAWSAAVSDAAERPVLWWGHQADHNVKYAIGTISNALIENSIEPSVAAWNSKMAVLGKGLTICPASDPACSDHFTVTIKTVNNMNNSTSTRTHNPNEGCGTSRACVKPESEGGDSHQGLNLGSHMGDMYIVFEDPPWFAVEETDMSGNKTGKWMTTEYVWTRIKDLNGAEVLDGGRPRKYVYVDRIMIHEFGHALGLPDFYNDDTGLMNLDAVMNESFKILKDDIAQLKAIYLLHSAH